MHLRKKSKRKRSQTYYLPNYRSIENDRNSSSFVTSLKKKKKRRGKKPEIESHDRRAQREPEILAKNRESMARHKLHIATIGEMKNLGVLAETEGGN